MLEHPPNLAMLRARREEILALADRYGAYNVRVVGSVARGEATLASDIDLLITARTGASVFDLVGLWLDLKALLDCEVSLITDDVATHRDRFMNAVLQDAVIL